MAKVRNVCLVIFFAITYNFNFCATAQINKNALYDTHTNLPKINAYPVTLLQQRVRRQTPTDLKNQYESVPHSTNNGDGNVAKETINSPVQPKINVATGTESGSTSVVPFNSSDRPLLGVNGTGQHKDISDKPATTQTIVSDGLATNEKSEAASIDDDMSKKLTSGQFPKKVPIAMLGSVAENANKTREEQVVDMIDVPENDTLKLVESHNFTYSTEHHDFYNSTILMNKQLADDIWNNIKSITPNLMLSQSHRRAMTVELTFDFPFYGHPVRNITVATGGFLYTGEYVHSWLAATQYIAPLMANFDTSLSNDSFVRLNDNGTAFTVIWENVSLQDKQDVGKFTFSATLYKTGDIVFTYFNVPIFVNGILDDKHPVKVGLSDAYIIDKVVYLARRKTIYEYHRVNFAGAEITNSTIISLTALTTCLAHTDCESCINHKTSFDCSWCPVLNRCSTGTDRKKQEWLQKGCDRSQITDIKLCPALGEKGNNAASQMNTNKNNNSNSSSTTSSTSIANSNNNKVIDNHNAVADDKQKSENNQASITASDAKPLSSESKGAIQEAETHQPKSMGLALGFLLPLCLVVCMVAWVLYAYRNPHTKSGQLLIQYRPSQWSWRRGEARYTAATIHM